jgi:hypothetical protein
MYYHSFLIIILFQFSCTESQPIVESADHKSTVIPTATKHDGSTSSTSELSPHTPEVNTKKTSTQTQRDPKNQKVATSKSTKDYYKAGKDPLAALYKVSKNQAKKSFDMIKHKDLPGEFPKFLRKVMQAMKKKGSLAIIEWDFSTLNHMKSKKNDIDLILKWALFGSDKELKKAMKVLGQYKSSLPNLPKTLAAHHKGEHKTITWTLERLSRSTLDEQQKRKEVWKLSWKRFAPIPKKQKEIKSCRFLNGIAVPKVEKNWKWMVKRLATTGDKRLTEWRSIYSQYYEEWRVTWVYRNGRVRDRDIGRWVRDLEGKKAQREAHSGLQQSWLLPKIHSQIVWWASQELPLLACKMDRPVFAISWRHDFE